jgi:hypothetical protein
MATMKILFSMPAAQSSAAALEIEGMAGTLSPGLDQKFRSLVGGRLP